MTLPQPGKVLVLVTGTFSVRCTAAGPCSRELSVQVGGVTVPGATAVVASTANVLTSQTISTAGILANAPAGTLSVAIASRSVGDVLQTSNGGDVRLVAIALG